MTKTISYIYISCTFICVTKDTLPGMPDLIPLWRISYIDTLLVLLYISCRFIRIFLTFFLLFFLNFICRSGEKEQRSTTYRDILTFLNSSSKFEHVNIISSNYVCPQCRKPMDIKKICNAHASSYGYAWSCGRREGGIKHNVTRSIRKGSWLQNSNLTINAPVRPKD